MSITVWKQGPISIIRYIEEYKAIVSGFRGLNDFLKVLYSGTSGLCELYKEVGFGMARWVYSKVRRHCGDSQEIPEEDVFPKRGKDRLEWGDQA